MLNDALTCSIVFIETDSLSFRKECQRVTPQLTSSDLNFYDKSAKSPSVCKKEQSKMLCIGFIGGEG